MRIGVGSNLSCLPGDDAPRARGVVCCARYRVNSSFA
jgi:hypothetical protein